MVRKKFLFLILVFFILNARFLLGVGIGEYSTEKQILFQPDTEKDYTFYIFDSPRINVNLDGDIAPYATLIDPNPHGAARNVDVKIKFPSDLNPGIHTLYIVATEEAVGTGTVGGIASVRTGIRVMSLYPGKYPIFDSMNINDVNVNETTTIGLNVINYGKDVITNAHGSIVVYDQENNTIATLNTESKSINSYESTTLNAVLDTSIYGMRPAIYKVVANLTYDGKISNTTHEAVLRVGQMKVNVVGATQDVIVNATNKYDVNIDSDWAGDITNVYARIKTPNNKNLKTPSVDLLKPVQGQKSSAQLEAYWETTGLPLGAYNMDITVYYNGLTSTMSFPVNVIDGTPPNIEKPSWISGFSTMTISVIVFIIVLTAAYFFVIRRGPKNGILSTDNSSSRESSGNEEIRPPSL